MNATPSALFAILFFIIFGAPDFLAQIDTTLVQNSQEGDSTILFTNSKGKEIKKTGDEFFVGTSNVLGYRTLAVRQGLFGEPLGFRENERTLWTRSFELGYRVLMNKTLMMELGAEYNQIGFQYTSGETDSFLLYKKVKQYITVPIKAVFQWGNTFVIQGSVGLAPKMFLASQFTSIVKDEFDKEIETKQTIKDDYNYFNVDAIVNFGVRWNLSRNIGLYFVPEFRYGLLDTYQKQQPHVQHNYGLYVRWGLHWLM